MKRDSPLEQCIWDGLVSEMQVLSQRHLINILYKNFMEPVYIFAAVITDFRDSMASGSASSRWSRKGWNGPGQYIELQRPDEHSKMTLPYIFITTVDGQRVPWLASQSDMLATDWYLVG